LVESIVRLGTWMPFVPVTAGIAYFCKVALSEASARRKTEAAGAAYVAVQTAQVAVIEREEMPPPPGPDLQQLSVDGAMVPLLHRAWGEVKTLALGVVETPVRNKRTGEWDVHTKELSYFSRLADHETFSRLATVETHRRGTATAGRVVAVNDGAEWEQHLVDDHRKDAVRILDWGHGAEHVSDAARAAFGAATSAAEEWRSTQLKELKQGQPETILGELRHLREDLASGAQRGAEAEALKVVTANLAYLEKRREQIAYATFAQAGYPIGSGAVESANKLVVEARLKGAGMHWEPEHVNPLVALRTVACSDRWEEAWPQITAQLRAQTRERAAQRRLLRREAATAGESAAMVSLPVATTAVPSALPPAVRLPPARLPPTTEQSNRAKTPRRPAADHPWRRPLLSNRQRQKAS
jgi:hypothetical protein